MISLVLGASCVILCPNSRAQKNTHISPSHSATASRIVVFSFLMSKCKSTLRLLSILISFETTTKKQQTHPHFGCSHSDIYILKYYIRFYIHPYKHTHTHINTHNPNSKHTSSFKQCFRISSSSAFSARRLSQSYIHKI